MCVIMLADIERPSEEMVDAAFEANDQGAGIAWREGDEVVWKKGLKLGEIQDLIGNVDLPFCTHFRIASMGGPIPQLTHPFPVSKDVSLDLEGRTKGFVTFHNGHWNEWKKVCFEICVRRSIKPPTGNRWSDSRSIAWLTHLYGTGFLTFLDEKVVAFGPGLHTGQVGSGKNLEIFGPVARVDKNGFSNDHNSWRKIGGVWCSNDFFEGRIKKFYNYNKHKEDEKVGVTPGSSPYTTPPASLAGAPVIAKNDAVKVVDCRSVAEVNKAIETSEAEVGGASDDRPFRLRLLGLTNKQMKEFFKSQDEVDKALASHLISKKQSKRLRKMFPTPPRKS